jgi:hypothetical protein
MAPRWRNLRGPRRRSRSDSEGPPRGLPPNVGAVEFILLPETKSDPCRLADIVIAYKTLSVASLGNWVKRLATFEPARLDRLFSSRRHQGGPVVSFAKSSHGPYLS